MLRKALQQVAPDGASFVLLGLCFYKQVVPNGTYIVILWKYRKRRRRDLFVEAVA